MKRELTDTKRQSENARRRKAWDKQAASYDKQIGWFERRVFGDDNRAWACSRANGDVLEVAVGTGLNLPLYPEEARVVGIDLSPAMLDIAKRRAGDSGRDVDLREGDAHALPFADASFDTVVCTFSLCNIPDLDRAISEMVRVMRPNGRLVLLDHVRSENKVVLAIQKLIEFASMRMDGDHMTRRPADCLPAHGLEVTEQDRFKWGGIVERLTARKRAA
jgi:ubiquinone/menaquinone biosynthesis C-methylase UbiE